jgi:hypothetical protein
LARKPFSRRRHGGGNGFEVEPQVSEESFLGMLIGRIRFIPSERAGIARKSECERPFPFRLLRALCVSLVKKKFVKMEIPGKLAERLRVPR